jgi:hypothetical protein
MVTIKLLLILTLVEREVMETEVTWKRGMEEG